MKKELEQQILQDYPELFASTSVSGPAFWGFECGDGWHNLINELCNSIQGYIKHNQHLDPKPQQVIVTQVKEKFGTLRFYCNNSNDYIDGMITLAENLSGSICHDCGSSRARTVSHGGWMITLCKNCVDTINNDGKYKITTGPSEGSTGSDSIARIEK